MRPLRNSRRAGGESLGLSIGLAGVLLAGGCASSTRPDAATSALWFGECGEARGLARLMVAKHVADAPSSQVTRADFEEAQRVWLQADTMMLHMVAAQQHTDGGGLARYFAEHREDLDRLRAARIDLARRLGDSQAGS